MPFFLTLLLLLAAYLLYRQGVRNAKLASAIEELEAKQSPRL